MRIQKLLLDNSNKNEYFENRKNNENSILQKNTDILLESLTNCLKLDTDTYKELINKTLHIKCGEYKDVKNIKCILRRYLILYYHKHGFRLSK
ncbi:MAG: hypothetical protein IJ848_00015 [Alphaproteobacteria bacterium]|nr:hypothetical protein [Alphaproteobacteria bacterium]